MSKIIRATKINCRRRLAELAARVEAERTPPMVYTVTTPRGTSGPYTIGR